MNELKEIGRLFNEFNKQVDEFIKKEKNKKTGDFKNERIQNK